MRSHEVDKIYVCNDEGDDLLMTGKLTLGSEIGLTAESPFCARCVVDDATASSPRVRTWQMWTVRTVKCQRIAWAAADVETGLHAFL